MYILLLNLQYFYLAAAGVEPLLAVTGHTPQDSSRPGTPQAFLSTPLERSWSMVLSPVELHSLSHGATEVHAYCYMAKISCVRRILGETHFHSEKTLQKL